MNLYLLFLRSEQHLKGRENTKNTYLKRMLFSKDTLV